MTVPMIVLTALAGVCALGTVYGATADKRGLVWIVKPAATIAIIALAFLRPGTDGPAVYKTFMIAGLAASLAGDIFLIRIEKYFQAGLASFLVAQILYIRAFLSVSPARVDFLSVLPLLLTGLFMMTILFPYLGRRKVPVAVYILSLVVMAGLASNRFIIQGGAPALRAFIGAILFLISDAILAILQFVRKIPGGRAMNLSLYFVAQWLLALSI